MSNKGIFLSLSSITLLSAVPFFFFFTRVFLFDGGARGCVTLLFALPLRFLFVTFRRKCCFRLLKVVSVKHISLYLYHYVKYEVRFLSITFFPFFLKSNSLSTAFGVKLLGQLVHESSI